MLRIAGDRIGDGLLMFAEPAHAQEWPARPVTMVVPYAAGGPVDTVGRILAARLGEVLGQQVIVENVGGAGGMTGIEPRREGGAGRLHVPDGGNVGHGDESDALQASALRRRQRFHAGDAW